MDKLYRLEGYSPYDRTGITKRMEEMAAKGWLAEKIWGILWRYRRIAPQELRFAISYRGEANIADIEALEAQKEFREAAAHDGWKLTVASNELQIFCNESPGAVPMETDPVLEVRGIQRWMMGKTGTLPAEIVLAATWICQAFFTWRRKPHGVVPDWHRAFNVMVAGFFLLFALSYLVDVGMYLNWYARARRRAERGEFLDTRSPAKLRALLLWIGVLALVVAILL